MKVLLDFFLLFSVKICSQLNDQLDKQKDNYKNKIESVQVSRKLDSFILRTKQLVMIIRVFECKIQIRA